MNTQSYQKEIHKKQISAARGAKKAELVIKNVHFLNVFTCEFEQSDVAIESGIFVGMGSYEGIHEMDGTYLYMVPGFIDGHLHLESSCILPQEYSRVSVPHGTTALVADPHEIANVCGMNGIKYMLESTSALPMDVYFMIPSSVPATTFDENGAEITKEDVKALFKNQRVLGLAEVMEYPSVIHGEDKILDKIKCVYENGGIIDGHAPGLTGKELNAYNTAGIYTDHECATAEEAIEKMRNGEWIMIREGTASRNLEALVPIFEDKYFRRAFLVTDDKHPGDLLNQGHIDAMIRKAIEHGAKPENAYAMASLHAASCFHLRERGAICPGYVADFVLLKDYHTVDIESVYKDGKKVAEHGVIIESNKKELCNEDELGNQCIAKNSMPNSELQKAVHDTVHIPNLKAADFDRGNQLIKVIGLIPGLLITTDEGERDAIDVTNDIIKLCVIERHHKTGHIGISYLHGYGLREGAIATTVAHDSHNIIVAGTNDDDIAFAAMQLKEMGGGMVIVRNGETLGALPLPVAGLMSELSAEETQRKMDDLKRTARELGVRDGVDPFMSLSFTSLPVIPHLKLTSKGVVDVDQFKLID